VGVCVVPALRARLSRDRLLKVPMRLELSLPSESIPIGTAAGDSPLKPARPVRAAIGIAGLASIMPCDHCDSRGRVWDAYFRLWRKCSWCEGKGRLVVAERDAS